MMRHPIPSAALDDRLGFLGTSGSGKTYNAGTAVEILLSRKARTVTIDPLGVWWGLRLLADGKKPSGFNVVIFGGPHGDLPLTEHAGALLGETAATMAESCIIDLSELKSRSAERRFMVAFLEALYRVAKANREPFHLIVDEADLFAPQKPSDGDQVLLGHMENIVRRGRVLGFIPWLISQRPAVLNKNVLSQVDGLLAFKLTSTQDRDALDAWIEGQADKAQGKAIKDSLPTLQIGQGVVWIPGRGILEAPAKFPQKVTFDSSRTPKRGERLKHRTLKPIDLGELRERLSAVEAETKANDPKLLRTEIADLKRQLAAKPTAGGKPDKAAIEEAEQRGFERAKAQLAAEMQRQLRASVVEELTAVKNAIEPALTLLRHGVGEAKKMKADLRSAVTFTPSAVPRSVPSVPPRTPSPAKPRTPIAVDGYTQPQVKVLQSLAMWKSLGHETPTREMVAAVAGYSPTSGGFNNLLGGLRTIGAIDYPQQGVVALLTVEPGALSKEEGRDLLLSTLSNPQRKIVGALVDQPAPRSRDDLGADTGYSPTSGGFNNLLGSLRTIGIIDYPQQGFVCLSDWAQELFEGERLAA